MESQLKDLFTSLGKYIFAAFVALLVGRGFISAETAASLDPQIASLVTALAALLTAAVIKIVQHFSANRKSGGGTQSGGNAALLLLCCTALGVMGFVLASCSSSGVSGSITYRDPGSGAKGGLVFAPGESPTAYIKSPIRSESGELLGYADINVPIQGKSASVTAEK